MRILLETKGEVAAFAPDGRRPYICGVARSIYVPTLPEGPTVGRRGIKEYRAPEALILIASDRDQRPLVCPSCSSPAVERIPERASSDDAQGGRVTLHCSSCGRTATYIARVLDADSLPEAPRHPTEH